MTDLKQGNFVFTVSPAVSGGSGFILFADQRAAEIIGGLFRFQKTVGFYGVTGNFIVVIQCDGHKTAIPRNGSDRLCRTF